MVDEGLRILVVSPWGAGGGYSGPITLLNRLFEGVVQHDSVKVDLLYRDRGNEIVPQWATEAIAVRAGSRSSFDLREQLEWIMRARTIIRQRAVRYDYVYVHGAYLPSIIPICGLGKAFARHALMPVLENGDLARSTRKAAWVKTVIQRRVISTATVGFALSPGIARELGQLGLRPDQIQTLHNAVPSEGFDNIERRLATDNSIKLGFIGRLGTVKQPSLVLESVGLLRGRGIDASAIFVGPFESFSYETMFRNLVRDLGLVEKVKILGFVSDVTEPLLNEMDVFVLPSRSEGLPGALVEAMMAGLPSVVTDVGSMRHHVESSKSGSVVISNAVAIADAVQRIAANEDLWSQMSVNAAAYAREQFDVPVVAGKFISALRERCSAVSA